MHRIMIRIWYWLLLTLLLFAFCQWLGLWLFDWPWWVEPVPLAWWFELFSPGYCEFPSWDDCWPWFIGGCWLLGFWCWWWVCPEPGCVLGLSLFWLESGLSWLLDPLGLSWPFWLDPGLSGLVCPFWLELEPSSLSFGLSSGLVLGLSWFEFESWLLSDPSFWSSFGLSWLLSVWSWLSWFPGLSLLSEVPLFESVLSFEFEPSFCPEFGVSSLLPSDVLLLLSGLVWSWSDWFESLWLESEDWDVSFYHQLMVQHYFYHCCSDLNHLFELYLIEVVYLNFQPQNRRT